MKLINKFEKLFLDAGYLVEKDSFKDKSAAWLSIQKKNNPEFLLELSFNYKGTKFKTFDIFQCEVDIIDSKKIF